MGGIGLFAQPLVVAFSVGFRVLHNGQSVLDTDGIAQASDGSVLLGIMEIFVASFNSNLRDLFVYGLLILVLVIKPSGLMGKVVEDKA